MGSEGSRHFKTMIQCAKLANNPANTGLRLRMRMENCPSEGYIICPYQDNEAYGQKKK